MKIYEDQLRENISMNYDATSYRKRAELLLRYSTFTLFGGEESYGIWALIAFETKTQMRQLLFFVSWRLL